MICPQKKNPIGGKTLIVFYSRNFGHNNRIKAFEDLN